MGLFDKLLSEAGKVIEEVATDENKEKAKDFLNSLGEKLNDVAKEVTSEENREKAKEFFGNLGERLNEAAGELKESFREEEKTKEYYEGEQPEDELPARDKILKVLAEEFPQYIVKEGVSPLTIGGTGRFMNYSIGVYDGETPKLFIMLIGKTTTSHREYRWSREEAEKNGIPFYNFIVHYPNRYDYIKERLHKVL